MSYAFYYIEAHVACICLLAVVLYKITRNVNKQASQMYLGKLVFVLILYDFAEIFWAVVDAGFIGNSKTLLYASNIFTYIFITLGAYLWLILSEAIQRDEIVENPVLRHILGIPVLISAILCITAFRTGFVFYVDENNVLTGGKYYLLLIIFPFTYMIAASVKAFSRAFNKDKYADRNIYFMIGVFPFAPIILGALQAVYWRIPLLCYGTVAAVYYIYITSLDNLISIDPLTQTNNRNQLYKYLVQKMRTEEAGMSLFLLIVDVDRLRSINDMFGHMEGDRALIRVAGAIKEACSGSRNRMFVSRYGGDEFVIVAEMAYRAEASWLADQIRNNIKRASELDGASYDITVSIGMAQYDYSTPISLPAFIARADSDLYKQKRLNVV